jgi:hypothetical protein
MNLFKYLRDNSESLGLPKLTVNIYGNGSHCDSLSISKEYLYCLNKASKDLYPTLNIEKYSPLWLEWNENSIDFIVGRASKYYKLIVLL